MRIVKTNVNHPKLFLNPFKNVQETQEVVSVTSVTREEIDQTILEILRTAKKNIRVGVTTNKAFQMFSEKYD